MKTKIKEYRIASGLTQQQLAEMVHVSSRAILSIEKEQYRPSLMLAYRLALVFHTTVEDLCYLEENKRLQDKKLLQNREFLKEKMQRKANERNLYLHDKSGGI